MMRRYVIGFFGLVFSGLVMADTLVVPMYVTAATGTGKSVGSITITETKYGLLFTPNMHDLAPGVHGFHIHEHPSCANEGMAAGGHFDPHHTDSHQGPYSDKGHLGDLPALYVNNDGSATIPVLAPRLHRIAEIKNHSLMVHAGGDNYSDKPEKLGGGGMRMECGVIEKK